MDDAMATDDFVDASIVRKRRVKRNANKGKGKTYSEWFDEGNKFSRTFDEEVKDFPEAESLRNATAQEIWDKADRFYDFYPIDSWERERAFDFVSEELGKDYDEIYNKWLEGGRKSSNAKKVRTRKVRASVQEAIDDEVITEEEARQAYALGLADALKEDVELDLSAEIEVEDPKDHDQVEQAIYDMGTQDGESIEEMDEAEDETEDEEYDEDYSEFEDFDDDIDFDGMEEEE